ncbi:MAG TPA: hypothetical protein VFB43_06770 [Terracidiphilus sp.]|nr:hypothetical protein [Terracidiphilus sp.]
MLKRLALKYWPIAMLSILIIAVLCMSRYAENRKAERQNNAQGSSPSTVISPNGNGQGTQNANEPHQYPRWIDTFAWPDGVTAWALLLTLIIIGWRSIETRDAAEAANRGLEISKTKERAKLLLKIEPINPQIGAVPQVQMRITNVGESSAIMGMAIAGLHLLDSENLDGVELGYNWLKIDHASLKKDESSEETIWWANNPLWRYSKEDIEGDNAAIIHIHGTIVFKDAFEDWWKRKIHYIWRPYGINVWMPHLQQDVFGEWESQTRENETRIEKPAPKRWWNLSRKAHPTKEQRPKPN